MVHSELFKKYIETKTEADNEEVSFATSSMFFSSPKVSRTNNKRNRTKLRVGETKKHKSRKPGEMYDVLNDGGIPLRRVDANTPKSEKHDINTMYIIRKSKS